MTKSSKSKIAKLISLLFIFPQITKGQSTRTLSGDQTISTPITVAAGDTLIIEGGSKYSFNNNIVNDGTIKIIGDSTTGLTDLNFASTSSINNSGEFDIENIAPSGPANQYIIAPGTIFNDGNFTISQLNTGSQNLVNFTLAPTNLVNRGVISFDPNKLGGDTPAIMYIGGNNSSVYNGGKIETYGLRDTSDHGAQFARSQMRGIELHSPVNGKGTIEAHDSQIGISSNGQEGQYFKLKGSLLYATILDQNTNYNYEDLGGSVLAWIGPNIDTMSNVDLFAFYLYQNGHNTSFTDMCKTGDETFEGIFISDQPDPNYWTLSGMFSFRETKWACVYIPPPVTTTVIGGFGTDRFTRTEYLSFFSSTSGSQIVTGTSTSSIIFTIPTPITTTMGNSLTEVVSYYTTTGRYGDLGTGTTTVTLSASHDISSSTLSSALNTNSVSLSNRQSVLSSTLGRYSDLGTGTTTVTLSASHDISSSTLSSALNTNSVSLSNHQSVPSSTLDSTSSNSTIFASVHSAPPDSSETTISSSNVISVVKSVTSVSNTVHTSMTNSKFHYGNNTVQRSSKKVDAESKLPSISTTDIPKTKNTPKDSLKPEIRSTEKVDAVNYNPATLTKIGVNSHNNKHQTAIDNKPTTSADVNNGNNNDSVNTLSQDNSHNSSQNEGSNIDPNLNTETGNAEKNGDESQNNSKSGDDFNPDDSGNTFNNGSDQSFDTGSGSEGTNNVPNESSKPGSYVNSNSDQNNNNVPSSISSPNQSQNNNNVPSFISSPNQSQNNNNVPSSISSPNQSQNNNNVPSSISSPNQSQNNDIEGGDSNHVTNIAVNPTNAPVISNYPVDAHGSSMDAYMHSRTKASFSEYAGEGTPMNSSWNLPSILVSFIFIFI